MGDSEAEAKRIATALASGDHVRALDPATERWCETQIDAWFAALSKLGEPITRGSLEYTSSAGGALARCKDGVRSQFRLGGWEHIVRIDRWTRMIQRTRAAAWADAAVHIARAITPWTGVRAEKLTGGRERLLLIDRVVGTIIMHLATLDDDVSLARPLIALIERRVFPLALPDRAMLLYLDASGGDVLHGDAAELPLLHALAANPDDTDARLVYADYLEERGDLAHAEQVRRADPPKVAVDVPVLFQAASWLLPVR